MQYTYSLRRGKDITGADIYNKAIPMSVNALQGACNTIPECKAFNSLGWFKNQLPAEDKWIASGSDLYIKNSR